MGAELFKSVGDAAAGVADPASAEGSGSGVQEIDSLCMQCGETGTTRLLLTVIPYFREVVVMSFACEHCGLRNSEVQPAAEIQERGVHYTLKLEEPADFNRQVVRSGTAQCRFTELELEIPAQRGQLTTVEGLLRDVVQDLQTDLDKRPREIREKLQSFIDTVSRCLDGASFPLTFELDDPAGNSWVEYKPGEPQHKWAQAQYLRTDEQNVQVGLLSADEFEQRKRALRATTAEKNVSGVATQVQESAANDIENFNSEVQTFKTSCPSCAHQCETHMKPVDIPHFKEVIIMATTCDHCGFKSNEVKTGGAIPDKGRKITLYCDDPEDLSRDILKSETCALNAPELNLDIQEGTLGGRFTTLEGLLRQVHDELHSRVFTGTSDSMEKETKDRWESFFQRLQEAIDGKVKFHVVMTDPLAGSYIQNIYAPDPDPNMTIEDYERTQSQNEELGLNDIKV